MDPTTNVSHPTVPQTVPQTAPPLEDHPLRYELSQELHARPFPVLNAPCHAVFLAIKRERDAAKRDRMSDRAHLIALLDRFGAVHPPEGATHFFGAMGRFTIKWECHTEFVTYTVFAPGVMDRPFDVAAFEVYPADWLAEAPGKLLTSVLVRVEARGDADDAALSKRIDTWFDAGSVAVSNVNDKAAIVATDFRIDPTGHVRMVVFASEGVSERRLGRIVQRLLEIETYKTMAMLGLPVARRLGGQMSAVDDQLETVVGQMQADTVDAEAALHELLDISAELEHMQVAHGYRFAATDAYGALVHARIEVMRETSFRGRQGFREFMMRRFEPAIRTVQAAASRLDRLTERAERAGNLLRTRVDVARSAENQSLLESMNRRADLQLRLQRTVEGLSVVAISYYAVNLVSYLLAEPAETFLGLDKTMVTGVLVVPVVLVVWWAIRSIRRNVE